MSSRPTTTLTDALGRKIVVRGLTVTEQARMMRAIGPAQSGNEEYSGLVRCACVVREIDGVPLVFPTGDRTVDANLDRMGDEGTVAVMQWMQAEIAATMAKIEAAREDQKPADPLAPSAS